MDLSYTPEHIAFRDEVRAWLRDAMPPHLQAKAEIDAPFSHHEIMEWQRILFRKGWAAPHWPAEVGGAGLDVTRRFILTEELELSGAPSLSVFGLFMVGPLLIQYGTDAQKQRFLPKILAGEEVWCQGYSEPNAGSDLASLRTSATLEGDHFIVNGQKTWTTYAQYADWIFCLVRTGGKAKKQEGISFLLIDMKTPGVVAKPFLTLGGTPAFSETFFDNVQVPKENIVGTMNGGWTMAKALLGHERTLIAAVGQSTRALRRLKRIAAETMKGGKPLLEDPIFRAKIGRMEIKLQGLRMANYRAIAGAQMGHAPGPESSILKIRGTEIQQQIYELTLDAMGENAMTWWNEPGVVPPQEDFVGSTYCYTRAATIYGGTNEIQKNIIAKQILRLG